MPTSELRYYTYSEIKELLRKAEEMGFDLSEGSDLERLTIQELENLLKYRM